MLVRRQNLTEVREGMSRSHCDTRVMNTFQQSARCPASSTDAEPELLRADRRVVQLKWPPLRGREAYQNCRSDGSRCSQRESIAVQCPLCAPGLVE